MIILDYTDRRPIYEQVIDRFRDLILRGVLEQDMPMPSVRALAVELSINPNTIQRAYAELERSGWIYSVRGKGSFIAKPENAREEHYREIRKELLDLAGKAMQCGMTKEDFLGTFDSLSWNAGNTEKEETSL